MAMNSPASGYDTVIVGGGHNGLVAAAYLAGAGRQVVVLEGRPVIGGMSTGEETVSEAPGFVMNPCAIDLILTNLEHSIIDELNLRRHGLRLYDVDPYGSWLGPDRQVLRFWSDVDRTVDQINHYSKKDGEQYRILVNQVCDLWNVITPYMQDHPSRPSPKTVAKLVWRAARVRKSLTPAVRLMLGSAESVLNEHFERDEVKDALAGWAGVGQAPLEEQGGAGVFAVVMITHRWGCKRPVGGMGAFAQALAAEVRARGGEIRLNAPVGDVICERGRAVGVALRDGTEIRGSQVIGALDPITLFSKLVDPSELPERTHRELRGLESLRHNVTLFKGDVALRERVRLTHQSEDGDLLKSGYLLLCPDRAHVREAMLASMQGELTAEPPMWVSVPSAFDRSLVPPGSDGDSLWVYSMAVPYQLSGGRSWADEKTDYLRQCVSVIDSYAPGAEASVIGSYAQSPLEMSVKAHKGNVEHVDATLTQLGPWRPTPSLGGYSSPIDGLWHTGAGNHPMPAVNGWSGRTAARFVNKAIRKQL